MLTVLSLLPQCQILSDKMEKQRIDRLKAESRAANKSIKEKTTLVAAPERRSGRSAVEDDKAAGASVKKEDKGAKGKGGKSVSSSKRKVEKLEMEEALEEAVGYNAVRTPLLSPPPSERSHPPDQANFPYYCCYRPQRRPGTKPPVRPSTAFSPPR